MLSDNFSDTKSFNQLSLSTSYQVLLPLIYWNASSILCRFKNSFKIRRSDPENEKYQSYTQ